VAVDRLWQLAGVEFQASIWKRVASGQSFGSGNSRVCVCWGVFFSSSVSIRIGSMAAAVCVAVCETMAVGAAVCETMAVSQWQ
jgi:hypothetical protein